MKKKMFATLTTHDGKSKSIYVFVDEETAAMLATVTDKEAVNQYLIGEYKLQMSEYEYRRHTVSFEEAQERGIELVSPIDLLEETIKAEEEEQIRNAIKQLDPQQQWLMEQIFYERRTKSEIAREMGIDHTSLRDRLRVITKKIKKYLHK